MEKYNIILGLDWGYYREKGRDQGNYNLGYRQFRVLNQEQRIKGNSKSKKEWRLGLRMGLYYTE